jgi:DnaK suppressor protein
MVAAEAVEIAAEVVETQEVEVILETETSEAVMVEEEEHQVAEALMAVVEEAMAIVTLVVVEEVIVIVLAEIEDQALQNLAVVTIHSTVSQVPISLKMLSISQRALLADKIREQLTQLQEDIAMLEEDTKPISPENSLGRISRMDAINNKSVAEETLRQSKSKRIRLNEALDNISQADFGRCQQCKEAIPFDRLIFMPESRRCMKCAR